MGRTCPVAVGARLVPTWVGPGTGVALWLGMTNTSPNDTQTALHTLTIEQLEELYESPEALAKRTDLSADEKREILERWKWSAEFQSAHDPHAGNPSLITLVARLLASPLGDDDLDERLDEALEGQDY